MSDPKDPIEMLADEIAGEKRMIRFPEMRKITGAPDSTLYYWMSIGRLKRPRKIGLRAVAWPASDVADFLRSCKAA